MSSTSRSPDDKPASTEEPEKKPGSPGRYSLADAEDKVPATRIDSTTRMPAVRPDVVVPRSSRSGIPIPNVIPPIPPPVAAAGANAKDTKEKKKSPIGLPSRNAPPQPTQRAMPAPQAKGASPSRPDTKEQEAVPTSVRQPEKADAKTAEPTAKTSAAKTDDKNETKANDKKPEEAAAIASQLSSRPPPKPPSIAPPSRRISSLRPPPPPKPASGAPDESAQELLSLEGFDEGSIAFAFDALVSEDRPNLPGTHEFDLAPVRELFSELAANHMRHVRDFMIDVKWGEVTRDWIHICVPPVRTLRRAAERLELAELGMALEKLGTELDAANAVGGQMLDANEKQRLLDTYGELVTILPQAFALDRDKTQREGVIVQALLLQIPDVRKVTIDKLHAAGLTSLTELFEANADDIAHVAGIPHALASRIIDRVQAYRAELQSSSPQDARAAEREKLAALNGQLKQQNDAYEQAANGWTPEAKVKKRDHFRAREDTWLEIRVLLARFGEVDRLQGIEKIPFTQRIAQLTDYLEEARDKYRSPET